MKNERRTSDAALKTITRRHFFRDAGFGIGTAALASLMNERLFAFTPEADGVLSQAARTIGPQFAPKAKQVIYLFMAGAPSQVDLFDNKPLLQKYDGQEIPKGFIPEGERFAFVKGTPHLLGSPFSFSQHGQSGAEISELLPHLSAHSDEIAIIRSMKTTQFNHAPAQIFMNTGHQIIGRPSHRVLAQLRPWQRQQGPPRLRRAHLRPEQPRRRQESAGAAASCPPSTRAWSSARKASRCCSPGTPTAWTPPPDANRST